jgi:hypothetical protein
MKLADYEIKYPSAYVNRKSDGGIYVYPTIASRVELFSLEDYNVDMAAGVVLHLVPVYRE